MSSDNPIPKRWVCQRNLGTVGPVSYYYYNMKKIGTDFISVEVTSSLNLIKRSIDQSLFMVGFW